MINNTKLGVLPLATVLGLAVSTSASAEQVTVFAAASLTTVLTEVAQQYQKQYPADQIRLSFASSSTLARQIAQGAPAQVFVSADLKWMDYLQRQRQIDPASRLNLLGNQLVLVAPAGQARAVSLQPNAAWATGYRGRLCMGAPDSGVPAGLYGQQALKSLNLWNHVKARVVGTEDVRSALAFVERGECDLGIVYQTDAKISPNVKIVATFAPTTHTPIVYPATLMPKSSRSARRFLQYLHSPAAEKVFVRDGFVFKPESAK
ncbi:MAG: molybdate ABC transporter substrate-binding protein [Pseudomonadota bacterium]|nr:molybdate ABC transporter substrate-binding protein [Pseudomonadota bacterium]